MGEKNEEEKEGISVGRRRGVGVNESRKRMEVIWRV